MKAPSDLWSVIFFHSLDHNQRMIPCAHSEAETLVTSNCMQKPHVLDTPCPTFIAFLVFGKKKSEVLMPFPT